MTLSLYSEHIVGSVLTELIYKTVNSDQFFEV